MFATDPLTSHLVDFEKFLFKIFPVFIIGLGHFGYRPSSTISVVLLWPSHLALVAGIPDPLLHVSMAMTEAALCSPRAGLPPTPSPKMLT